MGSVQNKNRIAWVDAAKAIAMFFVLVIHYRRSYAGRVAALGLMFCVQLFFFLSGMFASAEKYSFKEYLARQAKALLLPYAAFSVINLGVHMAFNPGLPFEAVKEIVINLILARRNYMLVAAMWFLPCLFLVSILYKLLTMAVKNRRTLLIVCFVASAFAKVHLQEPILPFTANQAVRFLIYFAAGNEIYPYIKNLSFESYTKQPKKIRIGIAVYTVIASLLTYILYENEYIIFFENDFLFYASLFINTVMIISLVVIVSVLLAWCTPLVLAGRNTLGFCCLENISRALINTAMAVTGIGFLPDKPLKVMVFVFLSMVLSYIILIPINRFCPVILGKRKAGKQEKQ